MMAIFVEEAKEPEDEFSSDNDEVELSNLPETVRK